MIALGFEMKLRHIVRICAHKKEHHENRLEALGTMLRAIARAWRVGACAEMRADT